jgi:hypothetical protein
MSDAAVVHNRSHDLSLLPPPLWRRVGEGVCDRRLNARPTPTLSLPHKGGGDHVVMPCIFHSCTEAR